MLSASGPIRKRGGGHEKFGPGEKSEIGPAGLILATKSGPAGSDRQNLSGYITKSYKSTHSVHSSTKACIPDRSK